MKQKKFQVNKTLSAEVNKVFRKLLLTKSKIHKSKYLIKCLQPL